MQFWLDAGRVLFRVNPKMQSLTKDQHQSLIDIVKEDIGIDLSFDDFSEALVNMLENVAGFEASTDEEITSLINQLWSQYHE